MSSLRITFDVVIATCNRQSQVCRIVNEILANSQLPERIIISDSSDDDYSCQIEKLSSKIKWIHSTKKNQPYQRFIGAQIACSDIVIFLDDDIVITDENLFINVLSLYSEDAIVAAGVRVVSRSNSECTSVCKISKSSQFVTWLRSMAFVWNRRIGPGQASFCGFFAGYNPKSSIVHYLQGAMMSYRREIVCKLFDVPLFIRYDMQFGKAEDRYISLGANKYGKIAFSWDTTVLHPITNPSSYCKNIVKYIRNSLIARYFLSIRYAEVFSRSKLLAKFHYGYYIFSVFFTNVLLMLCHPLRKHERDRVIGTLLVFIQLPYLILAMRGRRHEFDNIFF